jgi:hypothetical protein
MLKKASVVALAAGLFVAELPMWAHHAFAAEFDSGKPIKLEGTVTEMEWINPHGWIHLDVKGQDGEVINWMIEIGAPNAMIRRGFNKRSVPVGMVIVVDGYRSKDGSSRANGKDVTLPDGTKLFVGSPGTGAPDGKPDQK